MLPAWHICVSSKAASMSGLSCATTKCVSALYPSAYRAQEQAGVDQAMCARQQLPTAYSYISDCQCQLSDCIVLLADRHTKRPLTACTLEVSEASMASGAAEQLTSSQAQQAWR